MRLLHLYPPLMGAGVRIQILSHDPPRVRVSMPLRFYNSNMFGSHYGGSIFSMCDPFVPLILYYRLEKKCLVRDKHTEISFLKPGRGVISSIFDVSDEKMNEITATLDSHGKAEPIFTLDVVDEQGQCVAQVKKTIWIRTNTN
ncbi:MAG: YiiD C-terminal domain-containing protein [Bdellovibrionales bacterium]|nr:YiiD C-terminal domain-containing protein [Bdellovibrionales bacterium]